jgi:hypothetical protein
MFMQYVYRQGGSDCYGDHTEHRENRWQPWPPARRTVWSVVWFSAVRILVSFDNVDHHSNRWLGLDDLLAEIYGIRFCLLMLLGTQERAGLAIPMYRH